MTDFSKHCAKWKYSSSKYRREYNSWYSMHQRCLNPEKDNYSSYGGAGISICERWLESFDNFMDDMGERPEGMTLDRIDSSGNYEPSNCKWSTYSEQTINTDSTFWINDNGKNICLSYFSKKYGIPSTTIKYRIKKGETLDELKRKPDEKLIYNIEYNGVVYGLRSICREFDLPKTTLARKRSQGMTVEQALVYCFRRKNINTVESDFKVITENYAYSWMHN